MEEEETLLKSLYGISLALLSKPDIDVTKNYRPMCLMNIGVKIPNKVLAQLKFTPRIQGWFHISHSLKIHQHNSTSGQNKEKNNKIISINAVNTFDKIPNPFMIFKKLKKLEIEENIFSLIKETYV